MHAVRPTSIPVFLAALAGCVAPRPTADYGAAEPSASVVRASPYAIGADFPLEAGDPLVRDLVGLRDAVQETLRIAPGNVLVRVLIFDTRERYADFLRQHYPNLPPRRAFFVQHGPSDLVVFTCRGDLLRDDLRHEATHALLHASLPSVPLWLDEGLAEYFEAGPSAEKLKPRHVAALRAMAQKGWKPDLAAMERKQDFAQFTAADYREAWLWVHACLHRGDEDRAAFRTYMTEVRRGRPANLAVQLSRRQPDLAAWATAHLNSFPTVPTINVDDPYPVHWPTPQEAVRRLLDRVPPVFPRLPLP